MADEEDDYLSMTFDEPSKAAKETSLQRTARLKKEAQKRGRPLSKADIAVKEKADRETALATQLDASNKGAQMLAKMGFKGGALGKSEDARTQPIELQLKDDRGGIGMDSEKKRKIREVAEGLEAGEKRQKVDLNDFRERNRIEREEKRAEGLWWGAMKVLEGFEEDGRASEEDEQENVKKPKSSSLKDVNVLYRPLLRTRLEKERDRKMRYDLNNSLSNRNENDSDSGAEDHRTFDKRTAELDDEDEELTEYEALSLPERLEKVATELREKYSYCFWCKFRYPDDEMEGCPGLTEDEHG